MEMAKSMLDAGLSIDIIEKALLPVYGQDVTDEILIEVEPE